jgi:SurA-like N-terminal domain
MARPFPIINWLMGASLLVYAFLGCMDSEPNPDAQQLIRVGNQVLTVLQFNQAFEIAKTAYSTNLRYEPDNYRNAQLRLLNELTVEMIILERAAELGLTITDEEIEKAVADIKKDFPEGTFEKTLLEFAVSYEIWEDRLRKRLLMEKVIDHELKDQILITSEDIARYYEKNLETLAPNTDSPNPDPQMNMEDINEMIIEQLRREKMEQAYQTWINKLKLKYPIEINSIQWEKISGLHLNEKEILNNLNSIRE